MNTQQEIKENIKENIKKNIYINSNSFVCAIENYKDTTMEQMEQKEQIKEYTLKQNNFNPIKGSPNVFLSKLEFRIKNYEIELDLERNPLNLYHT